MQHNANEDHLHAKIDKRFRLHRRTSRQLTSGLLHWVRLNGFTRPRIAGMDQATINEIGTIEKLERAAAAAYPHTPSRD